MLRSVLKVFLFALLAVGAALWWPGFAVTSSSASASGVRYELKMTAREAVEQVRASGGSVHSCWRLGMRRFRCRVTYWSVRHEAEEVEPGVIVEIASEPVSEEVTVDVGLLTGVRVSRSAT